MHRAAEPHEDDREQGVERDGDDLEYQLHIGFLVGVEQQLIGHAEQILRQRAGRDDQQQRDGEPCVIRGVDRRGKDDAENGDIGQKDIGELSEKALRRDDDAAHLIGVPLGERLIQIGLNDRAHAHIQQRDKAEEIGHGRDQPVHRRAVIKQHIARQDKAADDRDRLLQKARQRIQQ